MAKEIGAAEFCARVDHAFDEMLAKLECDDSGNANLISHWQDGDRPGYRLQVTRKSDGKIITRFVDRGTGSFAA